VVPELAQDRSLPAVSLLPVGSVLTKVLIPRYDKDKKLTAVLRSQEMIVVDNQTVEGKQVRLEFYHPDRSERGRIDLEMARFDQKKGMLESVKPVDIVSKDFTAHGEGLTFSQKQSRGFLSGPVQTRFFAKPESK
jgi:lipopolysaccharide export system protein LptC